VIAGALNVAPEPIALEVLGVPNPVSASLEVFTLTAVTTELPVPEEVIDPVATVVLSEAAVGIVKVVEPIVNTSPVTEAVFNTPGEELPLTPLIVVVTNLLVLVTFNSYTKLSLLGFA